MKDFNEFLDALIAPDFSKAEHLDIPVEDMVRDFGLQYQAQASHIEAWVRTWNSGLEMLRGEIGKQNAQYFREELELGFMKMFRSMVLLQPKKNKSTYFSYRGPLDDKTRAFCVTRVGNAYTAAQIYSWNRFDWDGKIQGADDDIFTNLGGFGCRHYLEPE